MQINMPVTDKEHVLTENDSIVSRTDLNGVLTYINDDFLRISGFSKEELIGAPHNIVRHPDVPPEAFEDLWKSLHAGRPWTGLVKNRCRNGDYYWVLANVTPFMKVTTWPVICRCAINPALSILKRSMPPTNYSAKEGRGI
ncbi:MAG: PAS domain-containing protein [Methylococcaceae bacterium]